MIPKKYEPFLFGFLLSGMMSLLVSGISTFRAVGWVADFLSIWMSAWLAAWIFAFPMVLFAAPLARRMVRNLIER